MTPVKKMCGAAFAPGTQGLAMPVLGNGSGVTVPVSLRCARAKSEAQSCSPFQTLCSHHPQRAPAGGPSLMCRSSVCAALKVPGVRGDECRPLLLQTCCDGTTCIDVGQ